MIDCLEDLDVEVASFGRVEGDAEGHESVSETIDTHSDGTVTHVRVAGLRDWVVVDVDDLVEVECDDLRHLVELFKVVFVAADEGWKGEGSKVTDGGFIGRRVLDDLGAEVGRLDRAEVLLVRLACEGVSKLIT